MADGVVRPADAGLRSLRTALARFADERNWGQFHTPKNLAMALAGEVGELLAEFQWLTPEQALRVMSDPAKRSAVEGEIADVVLYLVRLADILDVDLVAVATRKLAANQRRFPAVPAGDGEPPG